MSEHRIQLRRGWQLVTSAASRLDLPADPDFAKGLGPFRLIRRFQVPRFDPDRESLALALADLPGLVDARLDGISLVLPATVRDSAEVSLTATVVPGARASLELAIDPGLWNASTETGRSFGSVALVIRTERPDRLQGRPI